MALATLADVEARLGRALTSEEAEKADPGLLDEASVLVIGELGCDPTVDGEVPQAVSIVTSRMVARVLQQSEGGASVFGASQVGQTAGPFSQQVTYPTGANTGAPWLTKADRTALKPYSCDGKAFAVDTAPGTGNCHSDVCSANRYSNVPHWYAYCTCGADIAGAPIYGG